MYVELYENALEAVHFENSCTFIYKCMRDVLTECIAFPRPPVRKLSGCDPHFRPSHGVAHCADQRGPRAAGGNSVLFRWKSKFCAVGYSVGRARAESTERIRKSSGDRENDAFGQDSSPIDWNRPRSRAHTMFFAILHSINVCKCTQKNIVWALDVGRFQSSTCTIHR